MTSVAPHAKPKKVAVLIFNLGGPAGQADVRDFLYNLFSDPYIIGLPWGLRQGVAALIANGRARSARANYARMGGGSPILMETRSQAEVLEKQLAALPGVEARVFIGMRYWHPFMAEAAADIAAWAPDEIVVLPLYPQFSSTTTLTGFDAFKAAYKGPAKVHYVCCYAQNDKFIAAHVDLIRQRLKRLPADNRRILFSAHGLPEKIIAKGDPYQEQVERCVTRIMAELGEIDHVICYQSRVGPMAWIGPSTEEVIHQAAEDGCSILVVPIAFVSEHVETLVELDGDYGELAGRLGIMTFERVPTLRNDMTFVLGLVDEVRKALQAPEAVTGDNDCAACHKFCPKVRALP